MANPVSSVSSALQSAHIAQQSQAPDAKPIAKATCHPSRYRFDKQVRRSRKSSSGRIEKRASLKPIRIQRSQIKAHSSELHRTTSAGDC